MNSDKHSTPKGPSLAKTRRMSHKSWKSIHGFDRARAREKIQYNQLTRKKVSKP